MSSGYFFTLFVICRRCILRWYETLSHASFLLTPRSQLAALTLRLCSPKYVYLDKNGRYLM